MHECSSNSQGGMLVPFRLSRVRSSSPFAVCGRAMIKASPVTASALMQQHWLQLCGRSLDSCQLQSSLESTLVNFTVQFRHLAEAALWILNAACHTPNSVSATFVAPPRFCAARSFGVMAKMLGLDPSIVLRIIESCDSATIRALSSIPVSSTPRGRNSPCSPRNRGLRRLRRELGLQQSPRDVRHKYHQGHHPFPRRSGHCSRRVRG